MKKIDKNNEFSREEDLTIEELKQSPELENLTDEQILQFIDFLKTYSHFVFFLTTIYYSVSLIN